MRSAEVRSRAVGALVTITVLAVGAGCSVEVNKAEPSKKAPLSTAPAPSEPAGSADVFTVHVSANLKQDVGYTGTYMADFDSVEGFTKDVSSSPPGRAAVTIHGTRSWNYLDTTETRTDPSPPFDDLTVRLAAAYEINSEVCALRQKDATTVEPDDTVPVFRVYDINGAEYCLIPFYIASDTGNEDYVGDDQEVISELDESAVDRLIPVLNEPADVIAYVDGPPTMTFSGEDAADPFGVDGKVCRFADSGTGAGTASNHRVLAQPGSKVCPA